MAFFITQLCIIMLHNCVLLFCNIQVVDRMVQQAVVQVLTPIFERIFSDNSFDFRPHRGAQDAIAKVVKLYIIMVIDE